MNKNIRTVVNFFDGDTSIRTMMLTSTIPNMSLGHVILFDHDQLGKCLTGEVFNIQHTIYQNADEKPVTYIDVRIKQ